MPADERLAAVWMEWWWQAPIDDDPADHRTAALKDLSALQQHLAERGFAITPLDPGAQQR